MSGSDTAPAVTASDGVVLEARPSGREHPVLIVTGAALLVGIPVVSGKLYLIDLVCLAAFPFLLRWGVRDRRLLAVMVCAAAWGGGQVLADVVNGLGLRLSMHLSIAVTVLASTPAFLWFVRGDFRRTRLLVCGVMAGLALQIVIGEARPLGGYDTWRYGLDLLLSLGVLALADLSWHRGRRLPTVLALGGIIALALSMDHRHLAGVAALTLLLILYPRRLDRHQRVISLVMGVVLLVGALGAGTLQAARTGLLGERSAAQSERYGANPLTFLINVRPEFMQELYLFSARPLTGFGSLPRLDSTVYDGSWVFLRASGVVRPELVDEWKTLDPPGVAAHSTAVDSWMRVGVAAVPFWILVWGLALAAAVRAIRLRSSPLVVMWTMLFLWYSMFEPITGHYDTELATYLTLLLSAGAAQARRRSAE
jgi:hypothetical protein